jgi:hypothetical protein
VKYVRIIECMLCSGNVDRAIIDKQRFEELKLAYEEQRRSGFWREWMYHDTQFCSFKTGAHCDDCHAMLEYERANA